MDLKNFNPCFLIAMPDLDDPHFKKTVVMLTDYNETGASGFIINQKTDIQLGNSIVLPEGELNPNYNELTLWFGGPVDPEKIWIIYDGKIYHDENDGQMGDDICIAHDIDILIDHKNTLNTKKLKIFHGFAGWSQGQLDAEFAANFWITAPISKDILFDCPQEKIWEVAIKQLGFEPEKLVGNESGFIN